MTTLQDTLRRGLQREGQKLPHWPVAEGQPFLSEEPRPSQLFQAATKLLDRGRVREGLNKLAEAQGRIDLDRREQFPSELRNFLARSTQVRRALGALYALLEGVLPVRVTEAEFGVRHSIAATRFAEKGGLPVPQLAIGILANKNGEETQELEEAVEEVKTMIRLLAIEDPFEGWMALAEEVSRDWPAGWSAVDEIRDQRGAYD